jgi:hypothetical protein
MQQRVVKRTGNRGIVDADVKPIAKRLGPLRSDVPPYEIERLAHWRRDDLEHRAFQTGLQSPARGPG